MMVKRIGLLFFLGLVELSVFAQTSPSSGDTINFTKVLFTFPEVSQAEKYLFEISEDTSFSQSGRMESETNALIYAGLSFGKTYYWRYTGLNKNSEPIKRGNSIKFTVGEPDYINQNNYQYKGKKKDRNSAMPGLLFMDYGRVAVNRVGRPIWYLPPFPFLESHELVRDLKLTPEGTVTGLIDSIACEMDLSGNILWQAPSNPKLNGGSGEYYHHDLKKLPNGNFMVLGTDHAFRKLPDSFDSVLVEFGTVLEFDLDGNPLWQWNSKNYFSDKDLFTRQRPDKSWDVMTHMNAFSTDGKTVLVGFRDISRIVAIDKQSGKAIASYGGYGFFDEPHAATGFFRRQHDAVRLRDGNLAVLNNDSIIDHNVVSSLVIFSPISASQPVSKKIFEFKFDFDSATTGKSAKMGNLQELENGNILINMGGLNRCIEITRSGKVVWDMFMEKYDTLQKKWTPFPQYRVSYSRALYPYVFRSRITDDQTINNRRTITVKVYNVGELNDSYKVFLLNASNAGQKPIELDVASGKSGVVKLSFSADEPVRVQISSQNCKKSEWLNL